MKYLPLFKVWLAPLPSLYSENSLMPPDQSPPLHYMEMIPSLNILSHSYAFPPPHMDLLAHFSWCIVLLVLGYTSTISVLISYSFCDEVVL